MVLQRATHRLLRSAAKALPRQQVRQLSIHEYQSHKLLSEFGAPVPKGRLVRTPDEARSAVSDLGPCFIKAQVLDGGRAGGVFDNGVQGGVRAVRDPEEAAALASQMLGQRLRTRRSPKEGHAVNELYVAETVPFDAEWYLAMTIDRSNYAPAIIISKKGGRDIDVIAQEHPESVHTFNFGLSEGITPALVSDISSKVGLSAAETGSLAPILSSMYQIFSQKDGTLLEVNPLAHSPDGSFTCLDATFTFDNSAVHRQRDMFALRDRSQEVADELEAERHGLLYVKMDGDIGNVVNGAGLAMATNDAIGFHGGANSNFLDAGGKATKETMQQAFGIITRDPRVKAILVNIYGGLTRCDMIAESIIGASKELDIRVPMVVRLQGTNSAEGLRLLAEANLGLHVESDFGRAAQRVVELAKAA
ncbi:putative beta-succinyl CoA synthetase precursor [Purpureocillium lilacinum]|uniref:Succinate--CoA ligase [ADP-forming] subunit beta, mitochondrial n=1 Tax=Purpureocillium lilacinum TaxID=33203 RepID=A0A2U3EDI2_PURLI|nr:putative beta-succinyl CoA synthetase precursor [Purpureocillium lilacinum]